jgi:hypothetical protein
MTGLRVTPILTGTLLINTRFNLLLNDRKSAHSIESSEADVDSSCRKTTFTYTCSRFTGDLLRELTD